MTPRTLLIEATGDTTGVKVTPASLALGPMQRGMVVVSLTLGVDQPLGEERDLLIWVRGCREYFFRWTVTVASRGIDACEEVEVEEDCLKILALYQPVAIDLRFVVAVLKMNNDLERMADTAVNIARRAEYLASQPQVDLPPSLTDMTQKVQGMVKQSLDAMVQGDTALARKVCVADREVDQLNKAMHVWIQEEMRKHPDQIERLMHTLSISRHLERIGDLATNVAEDVIYTVEGEIVRHRTQAYH
jgi:phosphate transport system protein